MALNYRPGRKPQKLTNIYHKGKESPSEKREECLWGGGSAVGWIASAPTKVGPEYVVFVVQKPSL